MSTGIDTGAVFDDRGTPIGLGYRVPLLIASPWTRGGNVYSQVTDHTSILQFLEVFLSAKTGKKVVEPNISSWRRTICGNLVSAFQPKPAKGVDPESVKRSEFHQSVDQAQYMPLPSGYRQATPDEIRLARENRAAAAFIPRQEPGDRQSCPLPYELYADADFQPAAGKLRVAFAAGNAYFGSKASGAPFKVYAPGKYKVGQTIEVCRNWDYAVKAGDRVVDDWSIEKFDRQLYWLRVYGPNGFFREFRGGGGEPAPRVWAAYGSTDAKPDGSLIVRAENKSDRFVEVTLRDVAYGAPAVVRKLMPGASEDIRFDLAASHSWYDIEVSASAAPGFYRRLAGRVETGRLSRTDPVIGRLVATR
jgi:phospholipase C